MYACPVRPNRSTSYSFHFDNHTSSLSTHHNLAVNPHAYLLFLALFALAPQREPTGFHWSREWLGKELSVDTLKQALYTPIVRPGKGYPDTIKLKVLTAPAPECYTTEQETIPLDEIEKGQRAMAIVELNSIWFVDGKFGVSLRLQQVMVEPSAKLPAFAFNP